MGLSQSWRLFTTALIVAFGSSFHSGYFMLVYNVPQDVMEQFVNESSIRAWNQSLSKVELIATWSTVAGINQVGRFISCFVAPICADRLGRRNTLLIWAVPAAFGFLLQYLAYPTRCYPLLAVGRLITGIYNGLVGIVVPLFLVEIAISSNWRGAVTRIHNVVTVLGSIFALILGLPELFGTPTRWSWLPLFPMPLLFLEILWLSSVPESPLQLIESQKSAEEVERSFRFYLGSGSGSNQGGYESVNGIGSSSDQQNIPDWRSSAVFNRLTKKGYTKSTTHRKWYLFTTPEGRRLLILWTALALAASLAGGSLTNNYSTAILARFRTFSTLAKYSSIIINIFKFMAVLFALYTIDRVGRRIMLLFCAWMVMLCYCLLISIAVFTPTGSTMMTFVRIWFVLVWTATQYIVNSTAVLIVSESCQQNVRALGLSLFKVVFHVVSVLVTIMFPALAAVSEVWSYSVLAIPYVVVIFYLSAVCPETGNVDMLSVNDDQDEDDEKSEQTPLVTGLVNGGGGGRYRGESGGFGDHSATPREIGMKR